MKHLLVLLLLLAVTACDEDRPPAATLPPAAAITPVLVAPARLESLQPEHRLAGVVKPRVEADLAFRVGGKLTRRLVDAGQRVAVGQVLAELDREDWQRQLAQAEAELSAARTAREMAGSEMERITTLRRSGWSTAAEHDRQRTAMEEAAGRATRAEHAVALARNALTYADLRADAAGVVTAVLAEPGQVLAPGQPAFRLAHLDGLEIEVAVPENQLHAVRAAQAEASFWALPDRRLPVRLRELSPRADPATRTWPARFTLPAHFTLPDDATLSWGMTASIALRGAAETKVVLLPLAALLDEGQGASVFVVEGPTQTLARRAVRIARLDGTRVAVSEGLADGDLVVQLGVQKLQPGQRVRPLTRLPS